MSINGCWVSTTWSIHTMGYYHSAFERKEILTPATTRVNLEDSMLNGISQLQKDKYYLSPLI